METQIYKQKRGLQHLFSHEHKMYSRSVCLGILFCLYAAHNEHKVSGFERWTDFAKRQKSKFWDTNPELQGQFHMWMQGGLQHLLNFKRRLGCPRRHKPKLFKPVIAPSSYISNTEYDVLHLQILPPSKKNQNNKNQTTDCSEYSLKLAGSVLQLLQWLLWHTLSASHQPLFCFFW